MTTDHTDHHLRQAPDPPADDRVTAGEIAAFLAHLDRARAGGPAEHVAFLAHKADLFTRIAEHGEALTDPELGPHRRRTGASSSSRRRGATRRRRNT